MSRYNINYISNMKNIIKFALLTVLIFGFYSCKTVQYSSSQSLPSKLPALKVDFDWLSIETTYTDGSVVSTGSSSTATAYGTISTYSGNLPGSVSSQSTTTASQYIKNPTIKWVRDRLTSDSYNICDKYGSTYGTIVWSVNEHFVNPSQGLEVLSIFTLGALNLLGLPADKYTGVANISANIYNKNNDLIATYSSYQVVKSYAAMWWSYSPSKAKSRSYNNAFTNAVNHITTQIGRDSSDLKNKLMNAK